MKARRALWLMLPASAFFAPSAVAQFSTQAMIEHTAAVRGVSPAQAATILVLERLDEIEHRRRLAAAERLRDSLLPPPPAPAQRYAATPLPPAPAPVTPPAPATANSGGTIKRGNVVIVVPPSAPGARSQGIAVQH